MHKKGITEEVAKKRSRKTVKHQRGIVGADLASIVAKRNQTAAVRAQARQAAISKAKTEKREKEAKKPKVRSRPIDREMDADIRCRPLRGQMLPPAPKCRSSR